MYDKLHNVRELRQKQRARPRKNYVATNGDAPLPQIIATKGVEALHPDGNRCFTVRESMALMGLPNKHKLCGGTDKDFTTQIGNGVLVGVGRAILKEVIKSMRVDDEATAAWNREVIDVDD